MTTDEDKPDGLNDRLAARVLDLLDELDRIRKGPEATVDKARPEWAKTLDAESVPAGEVTFDTPGALAEAVAEVIGARFDSEQLFEFSPVSRSVAVEVATDAVVDLLTKGTET